MVFFIMLYFGKIIKMIPLLTILVFQNCFYHVRTGDFEKGLPNNEVTTKKKSEASLRLFYRFRAYMDSNILVNDYRPSVAVGRSYVDAFQKTGIFSKVYFGSQDTDYIIEIYHEKSEDTVNLSEWLNVLSLGIIPGYKEQSILSNIKLYDRDGNLLNSCQNNWRNRTYMGWFIIPVGSFQNTQKYESEILQELIVNNCNF
jgi:hypothetical protein